MEERTKKTPPIIEHLNCARLYNGEISYENLSASKFTEIALVVSGGGICKVLGEELPCGEGDVFVFGAEVPHDFFIVEKDSGLTVRRLWLRVEDWLVGDVAISGHPRFCFGVFNENETVAYARLNTKTVAEVKFFYDAIEKEIEKRGYEWQEFVGGNLSLLFITIGRYIAGAIKNIPSGKSKEWRIINTAVRIIAQNFSDNALTLEKIAQTLYVSKAHFSRLFKRFVGVTFSDYLREVRIKHACRLLRETTLSVEEIVWQCGLRDVPTFYHVFQESITMTPRQYRESGGIKRNKKEKKIMQILNDVSENLQKGKAKVVKELVETAIAEGVSPAEILSQGLLHGMGIIGEKFKNNEVYVPEVLVAARAMNAGAQILKPYLVDSGVESIGRACIGTVQGDLHDIGKNLVRMMLEGKGLEVIDLGVDVPPEVFVKTAIEQDCQIICCSALLTTTMGVMEDVVKAVENAGIRDKVKIMVGGAPVTQEFCDKIGADCFTLDAASAADMAAEFCKGIKA